MSMSFYSTVTSLSYSFCVSVSSFSESLLGSQQYLIGISSWQANQRNQEHEIVLFPLNQTVPMVSGGVCSHDDHMSFCSRGDMEVIQVL